MKLIPIPFDVVGDYAEWWLPLLEDGAVAQGADKLPLYLSQIATGVMQVHLIVTDDLDVAKAMVGTRVYVRDGEVVGEIAVCAGTDMAEWIDLLPELETTLREQVGARRIVVEQGRPGWRRALAQRGYKTTRMDFERSL